jgi:hypothetical protein
MACNSGDGPMPVVSATGTVSIADKEFTPSFGASTNLKDGSVHIFLSNVATNCGAFTANNLMDGMYLTISTASAEKGIPKDHELGFEVIYEGHISGVEFTAQGYVEILDVSDRVINFHIDYEGTIEDRNFSAKGDFAVIRCQ